ncbi:hypothetical protein CN931_18825 [Bacillus sp. AFS054943]|uniref:Uncharacterized protein n=1 Tax=Bacillus cereus TaxID=1396 RepID=A0A2A8IR71_BACCE|nr:hypothetical protein CN476_22925 [Bacillus cereus]PFA58824.1 hypothetical protein CN402_19165 [Bacillus sp. AFS015896]PGL80758.1 hypothetical protein CN931_18825 [Bacillus sp. AFS054943]PGX10734.1 hypothetical protein COE07_13370 [Bacillus sp. AFS033286]PGZ72414.1 hypothetical protein COE49_17920 [Bacillus sp. AFS029637]
MKRNSLLLRQNIAPDYFFELKNRKIEIHRKEDIDE